jgi:hypothetical protein
MSPKVWSMSSAGAWYTIAPVTVTPLSARGNSFNGDVPNEKQSEAQDSGAAGTRHNESYPCAENVDVKMKRLALNVQLDWSAVDSLCEQGFVTLDHVPSPTPPPLYNFRKHTASE